MLDDLKKVIRSKNPNIDDMSLMYFANYFYVVKSLNVIPDEMKIDELIDNVMNFNRIYFFKDEDQIAKMYGNDFKGYRDLKSRIIYVRDSLPEQLKEIIAYHEIHHAAQTLKEGLEIEKCGINQETNFGRLILEAQSQWFAELVYKIIHNVDFEEKEVPSEKLRMISGSTILSSLHNYEMHDAMLSKLAIIMEVPKEFFVKINYMYKENRGMKLLEKKYTEVFHGKKLSYDFKTMMQVFDYAYVVDLLSYINNDQKKLLLSGRETPISYIIHSDWSKRLSQRIQMDYINEFDKSIFFDLCQETEKGFNGNFIEFSKYIFNDRNRKIIGDYIEKLNIDENFETFDLVIEKKIN